MRAGFSAGISKLFFPERFPAPGPLSVVRFPFRPRIVHPFHASLRPAAAATAKALSPALYGDFEGLLRAGRNGARVERAVFPLRRPEDPFLSDEQRHELWNLFHAPVYVLLVDGRGEVIGYECEAQEGIHLAEEYAAGPVLGDVEAKLCECGREGPRLMPPAYPQHTDAADGLAEDEVLAGEI